MALLEKGLSPRTIGHVHRVLHKALTVAVQWSILSRNPGAIATPPRVQAREIEIITVEQAQKISQCLRGRALCPIALSSGMRRGELMALRWRVSISTPGRFKSNARLSRLNPAASVSRNRKPGTAGVASSCHLARPRSYRPLEEATGATAKARIRSGNG